MKSLAPSMKEAIAILRALKMVALADQSFEQRERSFFHACQEAFGTSIPLDALDPITPEELANAITDRNDREATMQRLCLIALLDEQIHPEELTTLRSFAKALSVDETVLDQMQLAAKGHALRLGIDFLRRGFIGKPMRDAWEQHGLRGVWTTLKTMQGRTDESTAQKYRALGSLPEGSFGRAYFEYMRSNQFALPGEPKSPPEMVLFHDLGHVLTGFSTNVEDEVKMAGFEAGYMGDDGFSVAALALFAFHMGIELPNVQATRGKFDYSAFEQAWKLGKRMKTDLRNWDPWPYMQKSVQEVRSELLRPEESSSSI